MKTYPVLDPQATGQRIKKLRMEKHISVGDICEYMGFENPQAVYKWQRGESLPSVDNLYALSRLFETTMDNILCEREEACASSFCLLFYGLNYRFNDTFRSCCYNSICKPTEHNQITVQEKSVWQMKQKY